MKPYTDAHIEITSGSESGVLVSLVDVERKTVGSGNDADIKVDDPLLESVHFILEQTEMGLRLRDTSNWRGLTVNGMGIKDAIVKNQDEILAGFTYFKLHLLTNTFANQHG